MIFEEKLAKVVELAIVTEDRDRAEQKSLVDVAHYVDKRLNRQTNSNPVADVYFRTPSRLAREAGCNKGTCPICTKKPDKEGRRDSWEQ